MQPIQIGNKREVFWDDYLVDSEKTDALSRLIPATKYETSFSIDRPWSNKSISYPCIIKDENGYRMYYVAISTVGGYRLREAVLESPNGIHWDYSKCSLVEFEGSEENNLIADWINDNFFVFIDPNPSCPPEEKYKAVGSGIPKLAHAPFESGSIEEKMENTKGVSQLWYYTSADGYHFKVGGFITDKGAFDTLNTVTWQDGVYTAYVRHYHYPRIIPEGFDPKEHNQWVRGISVLYSKDFKTWSEPKEITFKDGLDYPLYTNQVEIYPRAPHLKVGFPVRYCERKQWTENFDQLCGKKERQNIMKQNPRFGLATTDTIFMYSRDGEVWSRHNEAFITPGYEIESGNENNWWYGDCYLSYGMIDDGQENYIFYDIGNHWASDVRRPLWMYKIRKDGFACYEADGKERTLVTKPLIFDGNYLHLNFSTSAYGHIYVDLLEENGTPIEETESFEIFGDHIDRKICMANGNTYEAFSGKTVRLRFRMLDAKIFSLKFEES